MRFRDLGRAAVGFALCFGVLEGLEAAALRPVAQVQAAGKVSLDIVWVAPAFHLALNALIALVIAAAGTVRRIPPGIPVAIFGFTGAIGVLLYSGYIGHLGSLVLAAGVAVQLARSARRVMMWNRWPRVIATLAIVVGLSPLAIHASAGWRQPVAPPAAPAGRPNVLLLVLDTVGADYLSAYGHAAGTTPALDTFAGHAVLFNRAIAASSWTLPSHASLLTGLPGYLNGVRRWDRLTTAHVQVQRVLHDQGYATGAFIGNSVNVLPEWGFGDGFDVFDVYDLRTLIARTTIGRSVRRNLRLLDVDVEPYRSAPVVNAKARRWIDARGEQPFFALINYMDAHEPYGPPGDRPDLRVWDRRLDRSPERRAILSAAYERCIRRLDADIGRFFDELSKEPWWNNTLVIVVADHGEAIADGSFDHGFDLRLDQIKVPLIVKFPGGASGGTRVETAVSTNDIAATIERLVGAGSTRLPGESLTRFLAPGSGLGPAAGRPVLSELAIPLGADHFESIVLGDYHYIRNRATAAERLFQFVDDPLETRDLSRDAVHAETLQRLRDALAAFAIDAPPSRR